jgi:hypothetical protein
MRRDAVTMGFGDAARTLAASLEGASSGQGGAGGAILYADALLLAPRPRLLPTAGQPWISSSG